MQASTITEKSQRRRFAFAAGTFLLSNVDCGLQLHWIVRAFNAAPATFDPLADGSRAGDLHHYNKNLADALSTLLDK